MCCGKMSVVVTHAGVVQWQNPSLPSWSCGFDSHHPLHNARMQLSWIEQLPSKQQVGGSSPSIRANIWWMQLSWLECQVVALEVVGSTPIIHPIFKRSNSLSLTSLIQGCSQAVRQRTLTPSSVSSNLAIPAKITIIPLGWLLFFY